MTAWPALVLTAGLGTRLRPLSLVKAKPAVPVAGEPLVRRIIGGLVDSGITDLVLNLHYLPESVCAVVGDGSDLGCRVRYSFENPVLGSAGGPRRALPLLAADRFFVVNGDTLSDCSLPQLAAEHEASGALVTLALIPNPSPEHYGGVIVSDDGEVTGFVRRGAPGPRWHYIGLQAVRAEAFDSVPPDVPYESVGRLYPDLMRQRPGSIRAMRCHASFHDIGTPADCLRTSRQLAGATADESVVGSNCRIAPGAVIRRSVLWNDVTVGPDAVLEDCIVADAVVIPPGTRLTARAIIPAAGSMAGAGEEIISGMLVAPLDARSASAGASRTHS